MKVYFHEDQLKDDSPPQLAIATKGSSKNKGQSRRIVISPFISVLAMIAVGAGAFAFEKRPDITEGTTVTFTPLIVMEGQVQQKKSSASSSTTISQPQIITQPAAIAPALPQPATYVNPYVGSINEIAQPKVEETVSVEPLPAKHEIEPPIPVTSKVKPDKINVTEPVLANVVSKVNENVTVTSPEPSPKGNKMERARILFSQQKYFDACALSRLEMGNGNKSQRHEAVIMTAQCYLQLGYKPTAQHLLEFVISEGGPGKKEAKRILQESQK